jgi:hypothetical protein
MDLENKGKDYSKLLKHYFMSIGGNALGKNYIQIITFVKMKSKIRSTIKNQLL